MPTSSEIEQQILLRAERRKKELMDTLSDGILTQRNLLSTGKEYQKGTDKLVESGGFKPKINEENPSPSAPVCHLLYPVRPARSVYNSPLIKNNRPPLWKSPPPYADQSLSQLTSVGLSSGNRERSLNVRKHVFQNSLLESSLNSSYFSTNSAEENFKTTSIAPLTSFKAHRLYPSLPRTDSNEVCKYPREEKDLKEYSNWNTAASATKQCGQGTVVRCVIKNSRDVELSPTGLEVNSQVKRTEDDCSPDETSANDMEDTYDMDRFLEEALGSALHLNSTMAEDKVTECSESDSFHSIETCTSPDKFTNSNTLRSCMNFVKPYHSKDPKTEGLENLLREAEAQQQVISQTSKALTICRSSKALSNSVSLVDAERLLLLATLRNKAILNEIRGILPSPHKSALDLKGQLRILEVAAPLKDDHLKWSKTEQEKDLWFLCVLCYGQQILASEPVAYESGAKCITFSGNLELLNLPTSFVASLQIYTLRTHKLQQSLHKSRFNKVCRLLRSQSKSCVESAGSEQLLHLRTPAFALSGSAAVDLSKVVNYQHQNLRLGQVPMMSPLKGNASVRMETSLSCGVQHSGFLTMFEKAEGTHAWQRRWCLFSNLCLHFWNYPTDQDEKIPLEVIDLRACSSEKIDSAPRHLCARSRTLMIETVRRCAPCDMNSTLMECNKNWTTIRYFLSCDTTKDVHEWSSILNEVLSAINAWNLKKLD